MVAIPWIITSVETRLLTISDRLICLIPICQAWLIPVRIDRSYLIATVRDLALLIAIIEDCSLLIAGV